MPNHEAFWLEALIQKVDIVHLLHLSVNYSFCIFSKKILILISYIFNFKNKIIFHFFKHRYQEIPDKPSLLLHPCLPLPNILDFLVEK